MLLCGLIETGFLSHAMPGLINNLWERECEIEKTEKIKRGTFCCNVKSYENKNMLNEFPAESKFKDKMFIC